MCTVYFLTLHSVVYGVQKTVQSRKLCRVDPHCNLHSSYVMSNTSWIHYISHTPIDSNLKLRKITEYHTGYWNIL